MCIILDANVFGEFKKRDKGKKDEDMEPIWNWLDKGYGKIVYSPTKKFKEEWRKGGMRNQMQMLNQAGKLKLVLADDVEKKVDALKQTIKLRSNDWHIIALAKIAEVKVLVVQHIRDTPSGKQRRGPRGADPKLQADFKDLVGGEVYVTKCDKELLNKDTCP